MAQLFACHTQYDLIMSLAIMEQYFSEDRNDLILFSDFCLSAEMKARLETQFSNTLIVQGEYSKDDQKYYKKFRSLRISLREIKKFLTNRYDRLFWKCDYSWPEIWLNKQLHKKNSTISIYWLEDGVYFVIGKNAVNFKNNKVKTFIRFCLGKLIFGNYYSFNGAGIGTSNWNEIYCLTYPQAVRSKYANKLFLEVNEDAYRFGMMTLYSGNDIKLSSDSIVLLIDKIDRYNNVDKLTSIISELISMCEKRKVNMYFKYHPRETEHIGELEESCTEIDRSIGAEGIYASNIGERLKIVGIASTSLLSARKCGYEVYSLASIIGETNHDIDIFYEKIGIQLVDQIDELF